MEYDCGLCRCITASSCSCMWKWNGLEHVGNSLPRYIRPTLPQIPTTSSLLETTSLPFGLILTPFATPRWDEEPIPYVDTFLQNKDNDLGVGIGGGDGGGDGGPPRCGKCRGYVNCWCRWVEGGGKWVCNLCGNGNKGECLGSNLHPPKPSPYFS